MELVYCGGCGRVLREDDFSRGRARMIDHRPWCADCKPPDRNPIPTPGSSGAHPRQSGSSARHPRVTPGTARRTATAGAPPRALFVVVGLLLAVLVAVLALRGGESSPPPPPAPPRRLPEAPAPAPSDLEAVRRLKELEELASLAPPERVLARCEELRSVLRGTPQESRFRDLESAARRDLERRRQDEQLSRELDLLRQLVDGDPRFERYEEVLRRFKAARETAGSRAAELDRRRAAYEKSREESPHLRHAGPFAADAEGFIRNWLVLGVFPNVKDQGLDTDLLGGEAAADPVSGQPVGKFSWGAYASPAARIDFFAVPHLHLTKPADNLVAYAACLVQVPTQVAAEFRLGSNDGCALWVYGTSVGRVHTSREAKPDTDRYAVPLPAGVHRVLLKVEHHGGNFEFLLRVVTPLGDPVPGLRVWN